MTRDKRDDKRPSWSQIPAPPGANITHISGTSGSYHGGKVQLEHNVLAEVLITLIVISWFFWGGTPSFKQAIVTNWCIEVVNDVAFDKCAWMIEAYR
jgi:hypothetical protein